MARRKAAEEEERVLTAEREAQENLRAKMALFNSDDEEHVDDFFNDLAVEDPVLDDDFELAKPNRSGPPQATNSLFDRPEMSGKKIKVVSAASKRNGENSTTITIAATLTAPVSAFTSIKKKPQAVDMSGSDSDDEIPASAPIAKKPIARPRIMPTRGGMTPTRGGGTPKRGRGRPRKVM